MNKRTLIKRVIIALVLVVIALILLAVASYVAYRHESVATACAGYLYYIDTAKQMWAIETGLTNGPSDVAGVSSYTKNGLPSCPAGGSYAIGDVGEMPACSIHGTHTNVYVPKWWER